MADDDVSGPLITEQIILRALLREFVKRLAQQSPEPEKIVRLLGESLQDFVNGYGVPGADQMELEGAKERARMNIDALIKSFERRG